MLWFSITRLVKNMTPNPADSAIMSIEEVADYLKVTEWTNYRLAAANKIPAFKVRGGWRFPRADIHAWIKQQAKQAIYGSAQ